MFSCSSSESPPCLEEPSAVGGIGICRVLSSVVEDREAGGEAHISTISSSFPERTDFEISEVWNRR